MQLDSLTSSLMDMSVTTDEGNMETEQTHQQQQILNVPQSIPLESSFANSLLGCNPRLKGKTFEYQTNRPSMNHTNVPSHIALALLHQNKTFTDRELPKVYLCNSQQSNHQCSNNTSTKKF